MIRKRTIKKILKVVLGPLFHPLRVVYVSVAELASWRFFPAWYKSFSKDATPLNSGLPWMPFKATEWLESYLRKDMKVFEYGSGGSTIFLAQHAGHVCTAEHDRSWHSLVSAALAQRQLTNCSYTLKEPIAFSGGIHTNSNTNEDTIIHHEKEWDVSGDFAPYVKTIDEYPDHSFDLILVDGPARSACLKRAIQKIRPGGYVMLDNADDFYFLNAQSVMHPYQRMDFRGIAPGWPPDRWTTSAWRVV